VVKGRNTTVISIRVPDPMKEAIKARADKKGLPFTVYIRDLIQDDLGMIEVKPDINKASAIFGKSKNQEKRKNKGKVKHKHGRR
jgi:predicted DNA-binding protein